MFAAFVVGKAKGTGQLESGETQMTHPWGMHHPGGAMTVQNLYKGNTTVKYCVYVVCAVHRAGQGPEEQAEFSKGVILRCQEAVSPW